MVSVIRNSKAIVLAFVINCIPQKYISVETQRGLTLVLSPWCFLNIQLHGHLTRSQSSLKSSGIENKLKDMTRFVQMSPKYLLKYRLRTVKCTNVSSFKMQCYFHTLQIVCTGKALANLQSFSTHVLIQSSCLPYQIDKECIIIPFSQIKIMKLKLIKRQWFPKVLHLINGRAITLPMVFWSK